MKINKDLIISDTSKNLGTLNSEVETLKTKANENVIWSGNVRINTSNNNYRTLSNMPNLSNYSGKLIRLYIYYGGDAPNVFTYELKEDAGTIFAEIIRDFSGQNDVWHTLFCFYDYKSTNWKVKTNLSYLIKNSTWSTVDTSNYYFYLRKVAVLDV